MSSSRLVLLLLALSLGLCCAQANLVRNPSFEQGDRTPSDWVLSAPPGAWETSGNTGARCVSVGSTAADSVRSWSQSGIAVQPFTPYRFSFYVKSALDTTGGCVVSGPDFCNNDLQATPNWQQQSHVFITRPDQKEASIRLGHWSQQGNLYFDDVSVRPVVPVHKVFGAVTLGAGEKLVKGVYEYSAPLSDEGKNYSRLLQDFNAGFNSSRWVFGPGNFVVYRHEVGGIAQAEATVKPRIGWYAAGTCLVEAGVDGKQWTQIGKLDGIGGGEFKVPASMLPAKAIYIRLRSPGQTETRADSAPGSFQIHGYEYSARLAQALPDAIGATSYLDVESTSPMLAVTAEDVGSLLPGGSEARFRLRNVSPLSTEATIELTVEPKTPETGQARTFSTKAVLPGSAERAASVRYDVSGAGDYRLRLRVSANGATLFLGSTEFSVPSLYATDYGYPLKSDRDCALWWCEGTYKVSRERPAPTGPVTGPASLQVSAARNEFEPVQLVLTPTRDLKGLTATSSDLTGPGGAKLSAQNVSICYVWYHYVKRATDRAGCLGWWPDALPPLDEPLDLKAGQNQPLWLTYHVPEGTPAGDYEGEITLQAQGWSSRVPVRLHVWNFTLPKDSQVASGFGLDANAIWRYNNVNNEADRERVWDLYMQNFRDHRISPYTFWRNSIKTEFTGLNWVGGEVVTEDPAEGKSCLKVADESTTANVAAEVARNIAVDPKAQYTLSFAAKTAAPGQTFQITLTSSDAAGNWISGHNVDRRFTNPGRWERYTVTIRPADRSPLARSVRPTLRATSWSEDGKPTGTTWFDDVKLVQEGTTANLITDGGFENVQGAMHPSFDFTAWDKEARKYLDDYHFSAFRLPLQGMGGGTFYSRHAGAIGPYAQGTPEYRRILKEYCMGLQDHLEQNGWLDKAYLYWFDEPDPKDYDFVRDGMNEIKLAGPKLKRMLTEEPVEPLFGAVDLWCPVLPNHHPEICAERQKLGETIWWYVCTGPKAPWPTLFIDHNAVNLRVWLWMTWKWNVQGILVWQSNYWTSPAAFPTTPQNPWEDPMGYTSGYGQEAGTIGYWGNGDGRFVYPANKKGAADKTAYVSGPVNSIRWEMLREGLEDFEYFAMLKQLSAARGDAAAKALLEVPEAIVKTQTDFTKDPRVMYQHRQRLAETIERLQAGR